MAESSSIQQTSSGKIRWYRLAALLVSSIVVFRTGYLILNQVSEVKGWEAYWVANALVAGEGFSMPNPEPWGYDVVVSGYHPTAWADPAYTYILAGLISLFGSYHQLAAVVLNLILLFTILVLTYFIGERLISAPAGLIAVSILAINTRFSGDATFMNNTMLAATLIGLSGLMLVRFAEKQNNRRAVELGLVLGITTLGCPSAQFFIFVTAIAIVALGWKNLRSSVPQAMLVLVMAIVIILPWNIRNYLEFETYVPIRTGSGWSFFLGIVAPAATVSPEKLHSRATPPWREETIREAVRRNRQRKDPLDRFQMDYAIEIGGAKFIAMNEARRDSWFLEESKKFIQTNPIMSAQIAIRNMEAFIRTMGLPGILVCLFAAIGGLLSIKTPPVLMLALWAGAYIGPFFLIICNYNRYRSPIEPLLILLATFAIWRLIQIGRRIGVGRVGIEPTTA